ncbi:respiratory nitrate reductase subunit gamma [Chloroflexota bacterium]
MDPFSFIAGGLLVYIAGAVFVIGMAYRFAQWFHVARNSTRLGMFPRAEGTIGMLLRLGKDSFLFPQVAEVDKPMWIFVLLLHVSIIGAFVGHLRLINEFTPLANLLGPVGMDRFSHLAGGTIGIIFMVSLIYLFMRRFKSPYKDISTPEDYLLLILILFIVLMGNHLRFFGNIHIGDYREYVQSLLTFSPHFPAALANSGIKWVLVSHVSLACLLFIYFPFSKLIHFVGTFAVNLIRSE